MNIKAESHQVGLYDDAQTSRIRGPGIYYDSLRERQLNSSCVKSHNFRGMCEEATALW